MTDIKRVAVLGSGTMGRGIAGICANAGCKVLLLDLDKESCDKAKTSLTAGRSPLIEDPALLDNISTGSFDHGLDKIANCQWICEVIVEDLGIKRELFKRIESFRSDDSIISTNTSGIPLRKIYDGMPDRMQKDIAVTHFFNPVHIMKLVELVPGENTRSEVISSLAYFLGNTLGKGVVYAKDTVNFIGNRIGCMWINAGFHLAEKAIKQDGLSIETVDALLGEPLGFPPTGLYGLADLIGIDVMFNVNRNLVANLPEDDYSRRFLTLPENIQMMHDRGQLGRKTGGGFYKLNRHDDGSKTMEVFDIVSHLWKTAETVVLPENEKCLGDLFKAESPNAKFVQEILSAMLCYTADLVPEISDDIVNVDRAMRWGFAWQRGPFELTDELGAHILIDLINTQDMAMPKMLQVLIDSGESTFYRKDGTEFLTTTGNWEEIPR